MPHPRRPVSRWARLLAFLLLAPAASCSSDPGPNGGGRGGGPDGGLSWVVEVQRGTTGGFCAGPDGPCGVTVTVHDDGRWTASGFPEPDPAEGAIPEGAATELAAILDEGWDELTARPFTGTCPLAYDGPEIFWVIRRLPRGPGAERADADVRELRSCTYDLERPAARRYMDAFEARWQELGLPA